MLEELINFNKGEAISQCFPKMPTPIKPPPGWEDHHDVFVILFLSKGADLNGLLQFADVMNNTYNVANQLVFPPNDAKIRYYANQRIQSHKRRRKLIDYQALL
jgi:hypothetical protein